MMGLPKYFSYGVLGFIILIGLALLLGLVFANDGMQAFITQSSRQLTSSLLYWRLACYMALLFIWPYWIKRLVDNNKVSFYQDRMYPLGLMVAYEGVIVFNPLQWVMNKVMGGV